MYSGYMAQLETWLLVAPIAAVVFFTAVATACLVLRGWMAESLEYEDLGDPVVRTLDIHPQWEPVCSKSKD
jgi:hypothetical protein